jgi:hypothetical protein
MERHKDIIVREVVGSTDDGGRITEIEVQGTNLDGRAAWILLHTSDATFRMSTVPLEDDDTECELAGLDVYEPASLFSGGFPDGITSFTLSRGGWTLGGTVRGTRRAIREFVRVNWTDGSDEASEQLRQWMDLVTEVQT